MTSLALQCVDDFSFSCLRAVMSFPPCVPNQPKPSDCCFSHCELISPRDVREQTAKRQLRPNVECVYAAIAFEHVTTASRQPSGFSTALTILLPFFACDFSCFKNDEGGPAVISRLYIPSSFSSLLRTTCSVRLGGSSLENDQCSAS